MAEEGDRAGREAVCTGLKDHDQIAGAAVAELRFLSQNVQRCAKWTDDGANSLC